MGKEKCVTALRKTITARTECEFVPVAAAVVARGCEVCRINPNLVALATHVEKRHKHKSVWFLAAGCGVTEALL